MFGSVRSHSPVQSHHTTAQLVAAYALVVIIHLVLIHTLHLAMVAPGPATLDQSIDAYAAYPNMGSTIPEGGDAGCSAPTVVAQRSELQLSDVSSSSPTTIPVTATRRLASRRSECVVQPPPGPDRQALLQRFTL